MGEEVSCQEAPRKGTLLVGPTHCEFGWLLQFASRARAKSRKFEHTIVVCEEPMKYLFADFAEIAFTYPTKAGRRDRWMFNGATLPPPQIPNVQMSIDRVYTPSEKHCILAKPEHRRYGTPDPKRHYDLLIHARRIVKNDWIDKRLNGTRNYPLESYEKILKKLEKHKLKIGCIGSGLYSHYIPGTDDLRDLPLNELCDTMASSDLCLGTSSFPLHLANACGCKTIVMTDNARQKSIKATNRVRYEKKWRMTDAAVWVIDEHGWKPPEQVVWFAIVDTLKLERPKQKLNLAEGYAFSEDEI